jgi:hypothetical protein
MDYDTAKDYCKFGGASLPTKEQFERLKAHLGYGTANDYSPYMNDGQTEILPRLTNTQWTSSVNNKPGFTDPSGSYDGYAFGGVDGMFTQQNRKSDVFAVRCIYDLKADPEDPADIRIAPRTNAKFFRDQRFPNMGEAWRDPSGLVWSGTRRSADGKKFVFNTHIEATKYCTAKGGRLPTAKEFEGLANFLGANTGAGYSPHLADGKTSILPGLSIEEDYFKVSNEDKAKGRIEHDEEGKRALRLIWSSTLTEQFKGCDYSLSLNGSDGQMTNMAICIGNEPRNWARTICVKQ